MATGITPVSLNAATAVLSKAFSKLYIDYNKRNWRVHELLFNLVALNNTVSDKHGTYTEITKLIDLSDVDVPAQNEWVYNKALFTKKLEIHLLNKDRIMEKLNKRIII